MKKLIACLVALFVLVGCAQQAEQKTVQQAAVQEPAGAEESGAAAEAAPSNVLSDEIRNEIMAQLKPGVKSSSIIPTYKILKYGDSVVFGVGVQNIQNADDDFLIKVTFDKAYDKYTNTIQTSEELMNGWIKTKLEPFTLSQNEKEIVSVVIEAGQTMPGVKPKTGTYVFDIETLQKRGGYSINKEYFGKREFTVRVD